MALDNKESQPLTKKDLEELKDVLGEHIALSVHRSLEVLMQKEQAKISRMINDAIREASCNCPMDECQKRQVPAMSNLLSDFGDGDTGKGLLEIRKNHVWVSKFRSRTDSYGASVTVTILIIIVSGALAALWHGIKSIAGD